MLKVDSRNSICVYDEESLADFKINLFAKLSELEDVDTQYAFEYLEKTYFKDYLGILGKKKKKKENFKTSDVFLNFFQFSLTFINAINAEMNTNIYEYIKDDYNTNIQNAIHRNFISMEEGIVHQLGMDLLTYFPIIENNFKILTSEDFIIQLKLCEYSPEEEEEEASVFNINADGKLNGAIQFPSRLRYLSHIFKNVNKIKIEMPNSSDFDVRMYILFFLNIQWMFPNLNEMYIDFHIELFQNVTTFLKSSDVNQTHLNNDYTFDKKPLSQIIKEHKSLYDLILITPYFASGCFLHLNIPSLVIRIPDSHTKELKYLLKKEKVSVTNFHLLNIFDMNTNLTKLSLEFNSLDHFAFHRILSIILNNNYLKDISLTLFPEEEYFTSYSIQKIESESNNDIDKRKNNHSNLIIDEHEYMMSLLYPKFENNLEYLAYLLGTKLHSLREIRFYIDLPGIFFINDKYINTMHKFILNLFMMLSDELKMINIATFELFSSNFVLDARKFPNLNSYINDYVRLNSNENIQVFTINFKMSQISTIQYLIPENVCNLTLSDLDLKTFEEFIPLVKNYSNLTVLSLGLSNLSCDDKTNKCQALIYQFFNNDKGNNLTHIQMTFKYPIEHSVIEKISSIVRMKPSENLEKVSLFVKQYECEASGINLVEDQAIYMLNDYERMYEVIFSLQKCIKDLRIWKTICEYLKKKKMKSVSVQFY